MRVANPLVFQAVDASANQISKVVEVSEVAQASFQAVVTGNAAGTIKLQFSDDQFIALNGQTPNDWTDVPSSSVPVTGPGVFGLPKIDLCYNYIRAVYTVTSGTGTLSVIVKLSGF